MRSAPFLSLVLACAFLAAANGTSAQIEHGGTPLSLSHANKLPPISGVRMPQIDLEALRAQDLVNDQDKSIPWRFGYNHQVELGIDNSGSWTTLPNGNRIWRLGIECPGALSINFEFDEFDIPDGARVFVVNDSGEHIGAFTNANDHGQHVLGVQAMKGERITVEYQVPAGSGPGRLRIGQVTHGYRDIFKYARGLGDSGSCNNNVICSEFDPWRDQIRSVAIITVGGSGLCTGTLINNCNEDGTPYFLTARHCLPSNDNVSTWVFRFNWESPSCTQNQNGPTNQTISGAALLAQNAGTDMALLQLNSTPPTSYNVYYSGWDRSGTTPTSNVAIHHPRADVKKITFDDDAAGQATYGGANCWRIYDWEDGTTEPGSSGSGLWDQNKRLIGQLYGGQASCSNNVNDYYGRFDLSYPVIQSWLGSCGNTLNGFDPNAPSLALDAEVQQISGLNANSLCNSTVSPTVTVRNAGVNTLTSFQLQWSITNGGSGNQNWTGSLASNNTVDIVLSNLPLPVGMNTLSVAVAAPNGGVDGNPANNSASAEVVYGNNEVTFSLVLDRYGNETTWQIIQGATVFASGGPYSQAGSNGQYPQAPVGVCLPNGCYELVVNDSWGDGICCSYGAGSFTLTDQQGSVLATGGSFTSTSIHPFCVEQGVPVTARVRLEGPYVSGTQLMSDQLRSQGLLPSTEPYTGLGYVHVGGGGETMQAGVVNITGANAIVDWVVVELRSAPGNTVVASRSALLQRDGDIVDTDGISPVVFPVPSGNYHVAVRHRNHLGIMTAAAIPHANPPALIDLSSGATAIHGTAARKNISGVHVMWAGNAVRNNVLSYTGANNDRDAVLVRIGGTVPTLTVNGYHLEDVNMDGVVRYTGGSNDRDPILQNIGGTVPTALRTEQLP